MEETSSQDSSLHEKYFPEEIPPSLLNVNDKGLLQDLKEHPVTKGARAYLHTNKRYLNARPRVILVQNAPESVQLIAAVYDSITGKLIAWGKDKEIHENY